MGREINGYIMPSGENNETDDQSYLNQDIEIDAIAFTHWLIKKKFELNTYIPSLIQKNVYDKINKFK